MKKPKNVCDGSGKGVIFLGRGFYSGIIGLCVQPYKEINNKGSHGIFKGIGKGLGGLILKPVAGVFDAMSVTSEGTIKTL